LRQKIPGFRGFFSVKAERAEKIEIFLESFLQIRQKKLNRFAVSHTTLLKGRRKH